MVVVAIKNMWLKYKKILFGEWRRTSRKCFFQHAAAQPPQPVRNFHPADFLVVQDSHPVGSATETYDDLLDRWSPLRKYGHQSTILRHLLSRCQA